MLLQALRQNSGNRVRQGQAAEQRLDMLPAAAPEAVGEDTAAAAAAAQGPHTAAAHTGAGAAAGAQAGSLHHSGPAHKPLLWGLTTSQD